MDVDPRLLFLFDAMVARARRRLNPSEHPRHAHGELGLFVEALSDALHDWGFRSATAADWPNEFKLRGVDARKSTFASFVGAYDARNTALHHNPEHWGDLTGDTFNASVYGMKASLPAFCRLLWMLGPDCFDDVLDGAFATVMQYDEMRAAGQLSEILMKAVSPELIQCVDDFAESHSLASEVPRPSPRFSAESRLPVVIARIASSGASVGKLAHGSGEHVSKLSKLASSLASNPGVATPELSSALDAWHREHEKAALRLMAENDFGLIVVKLSLADDGYVVESVRAVFPVPEAGAELDEEPRTPEVIARSLDELGSVLESMIPLETSRLARRLGRDWSEIRRYVVQFAVPDEVVLEAFESARLGGDFVRLGYACKCVTVTRARRRLGAFLKMPMFRSHEDDVVLDEPVDRQSLPEARLGRAKRVFVSRTAREALTGCGLSLAQLFAGNVVLAVMDDSRDVNRMLASVFDASDGGLAYGDFFDRVTTWREKNPLRLLWHDNDYSDRLSAVRQGANNGY
jgi:hypothetical protein